MIPMSAGIQLDNISIQIGAKTLFQNLALTISKTSRLGIVGPNGSGKSTLLRILAVLQEPDVGRVVSSGSLRVAYVPQMEEFRAGCSALEVAMERLERTLSGKDSQVVAARALTKAGFNDISAQVSTLSGGWRKRLSLAIALAAEPELLLLDEPTNHLDLSGLLWLEHTLNNASFGWALVSHDRYFLEKTAKRILEIAPVYAQGTFESRGSYLEFKENRAAFLEQESKRTSALANIAKRELDWASRSPSARTGKASFRLKNAQRLKQELASAKARQEREQTVTSFQSSERATKELVKLIKCSFSYEDKQLISNLSIDIPGRTCLGLLGANGQGKSTLLKLFGGKLQPSTGKVKHVQGLKIVYFDQLRGSLAEWRTLGELLGEGFDHIVYQGKQVHIAGWGKRFGFDTADHPKAISDLSGGEQARALLSVLVRQEADLLLLDEPTNDLDIGMLELLENMILEFSGAVVLVSHDRFMLDEVCTQFLGFMPDGRLEFFASFEQWQDAVTSEQSEKKETSAKSVTRSKSPSTKMSYKDTREFGTIEADILKAEARLAEIEILAAQPDSHSNAEKSVAISQQLSDAKGEVERLYQRWEVLEALHRESEQRVK
jgi:ATP-binding cassette subfamily F protein uup